MFEELLVRDALKLLEVRFPDEVGRMDNPKFAHVIR